MPTTDPAKLRIAATYDAAADHFDDRPLGFWQRAATRTLDLVRLHPGQSVLDVACGTGASALLAATRVRPGGTVLAIDIAERLLQAGRSKAAAMGLDNIEFHCVDMEEIGDWSKRFDAVVCIFGIFFVQDMAAQVRRLISALKPGGCLAITVWGGPVLEPGSAAFWEAIDDERPDLRVRPLHWERVPDVESLQALLHDGGVGSARVLFESGEQPLRSVDDWWTVVMGTGMRGTVEQLDDAARARVRTACLNRLRDQRVVAVQTDIIYSVATKPLV